MSSPPADRPVPPNPASAADARRVKALTQSVAAGLRRRGTPAIDPADNAWLESRPQSLWPLLDAAEAASAATPRDEALITTCRWLLANQLELIRYRLERGHDWAAAMLAAYQERLIALAQAGTVAESDWFELVNLLQIAKVPVSPAMTEALAMATVDDEAPDDESSLQEIQQHLRANLDDLGRSAKSPFMVVEGFTEASALMPAELRTYLTLELALSPYPVLREAVPLLLLDAMPAVRQAAAAALEQIATPESFSPLMLRRALLVRNWVPEAEREAIDRLVRKARLKGVVCAQWAPPPALAVQSTMVDGSGAQSLILTTPTGRTGLFAGLLLKQGFGIRDSWCDSALARREITGAIKGAQQKSQWLPIGRAQLDVVVQHHIARGLGLGNLPQVAVLEIAEAVGAADWKDRSLDVAAETEQLFVPLGIAGDPAAVTASLRRGGAWVERDPMMQSWFEDDAEIRALIQRRMKPEAAVRAVLQEGLPARRQTWAERALLMALWLRADQGTTFPPERWQDCVVLAHELLAGRPMAELPAMVAIADRTVFAARRTAW